MRLPYLSLFVLVVLSFPLNAQTLFDLGNVLEREGASKLVEFVNLHRDTNSDASYVVLEERLMDMGSDKVIEPNPKWKATPLKSGTGVQLYLKLGHQYFETSPVKILNLESCPGGGATSGGAYKNYLNGTSIEFSWSCGSAGCSYQARFGDGYSPCK